MANDPVNAANGTTSVQLDPGKTMTVTGGTASTKGAISVLTGAGTVESTDQLQGTTSKSYGPFAEKRTVRLYAEAGRIDYIIASRLAALPVLQPPTVSADGKSISGQGVKPLSQVPVYNIDTGIPLGTATAAADGSWVLILKVGVSQNDRIGYDPTIVGPYAVVGSIVAAPGQVTGLTLGTATASTQPLSWNAPTDGGAADAYTVEYRLQGASIWNQATTSATGTSFTVTDLAAATAYQYRVTATNGTGTGTASAIATGSTAAAQTPGTPDSTTNFDDEANSALVPGLTA